jgi:hypothetical protein
MMTMRETPTFRIGRSIITWSFDVPLHGEAPAAELRHATVAVFDSLGGFAHPAKVRLSSVARGEFGTTLEPPLEIDAVIRALEEIEGVYNVGVELDLEVTDTSGEEREMKAGASLSIVLDDAEGEECELYINLTLNTDIYAARTLAPEPTDNPLATANAPRLADFLARLHERLATRLYDLQADWYAPQVDEHGFR